MIQYKSKCDSCPLGSVCKKTLCDRECMETLQRELSYKIKQNLEAFPGKPLTLEQLVKLSEDQGFVNIMYTNQKAVLKKFDYGERPGLRCQVNKLTFDQYGSTWAAYPRKLGVAD